LILTISEALAAEKNKNKPETTLVDNYIAIFDFEVRTGDKDISRSLADSVIHEFSKSDKYEVIDRGNMNKILKEQKFQMSGCVAQECKVEAGQLLGVGKIVNGSVGMLGETYYLTLQLINVQTGKVELSAEDKCKCKIDDLIDSTKRLAKRLLGEKIERTPAAEQIDEQKRLADEERRLEEEKLRIASERASFQAEKEEIERQKKEAQRPVPSTAKEIRRDGRFIAYDNGTVLDTRTKLMWASKDNGYDINWQNAKNYCESFRGGGYSDWRMPTQDELAGLYDPTKTYQSECKEFFSTHDLHLTELIRLTCTLPWASETHGSKAAIFVFMLGHGYWDIQSGEIDLRALPVRSGK
jgi:TolB-like protein